MKSVLDRFGFALFGMTVMLLGFCFFAWQHHQPSLKTLSMTVLDQPRQVLPFEMENRAQRFTEDNLKGHWTWMFFGFSRCGMMCPTTMGQLNQVYQQLEQDRIQNKPRIVMVTIDPAFDSAERIDTYAKNFNTAFVGVRPSPAVLKQLTQAFGIVYFRNTDQSANAVGKAFNHSGAVIVFDPNGRLFGFFTTPHTAQHMARDHEALLKIVKVAA